MKSFWWKCQVINGSNEPRKRSGEGKSQRDGEDAPRGLLDQQPLAGRGRWVRAGRERDADGALEVGTGVMPGTPGRLTWLQRLWPPSALPTQKIAYSTLSVKLWRPPFMDLEVGLCVSAFAC